MCAVVRDSRATDYIFNSSSGTIMGGSTQVGLNASGSTKDRLSRASPKTKTPGRFHTRAFLIQ